MALGTTFYSQVPGTTNSSATNPISSFIPELWTDEILDALEKKLVLAKLVNTDFSDMVKSKGDMIRIPTISNLTANAKQARTAVTVQAPAESVTTISVDQHYEVSFLVEDLAEIQTAVNLRSIYTKRAGYAIANQVDSALKTLAEGSFDIIDGTSAAGNTSFLEEADILLAKTLLDENYAPMEDRHIVVAPQQYNKMLAIERFTAADKLGPNYESEIRRGLLGTIHGFQVWMTQQLAATGTTTTDTCNTLIFQRDALALVMQLAPRTQANYIPEYLGNLVTIDMIYGLNELRDDWGFVLQNDAVSYSVV